jgi:uroporphyrinogen III methyltransferase / synthase
VTRIVVTRAREQARDLVQLLEEAGYEVVVSPLIEIVPLGDEPIDVSSFDWVVITSANGASELRRRMQGTPARVAAIGRATAAAFGAVDLIPEIATQEGLLAELPRPAGRVLFAGAEGARQLIVQELEAEFVALYRTRTIRPLTLPQGDLAILASPSAARALAALEVPIHVVSIGPETTRVAKAAGLTVRAEAATHDSPGLVAAVRAVAPASS